MPSLGLADLEKAASGASDTCGHFVGNQAILRIFWAKYPVLLTEDGGKRIEDGEMRLDQGDLRYGWWRMKHLVLKIEDGGLWIEDRPSRFEDFIMPHQHLIHIFRFIHCRELRYFEDIVKLWISAWGRFTIFSRSGLKICFDPNFFRTKQFVFQLGWKSGELKLVISV